MKQIGDYLYTINESSLRVHTWKIREMNGDCYVCERRRSDRICEFSKDDPGVYDTEEDAMKVIRKTKMKKGLFVAGFFFFVAVIIVIIVLFQIITGYF